MQFSDKSRAILQAIAKGHSYEQILVQELAWTYQDIFAAAQEALEISALGSLDPQKPSYEERMEQIRSENPRAYEKWSPQEDEQLKSLHAAGQRTNEIALALKRQPSAIRSRLVKFGLR